MSNSDSARNGLATWRARQAEEKRLRLQELEHYRALATTEVRDGREFTVVRIPDRYDDARPVFKPSVRSHRQRKRT